MEEKFVLSIQRALSFVDLFGDNFGNGTLKEALTVRYNKVGFVSIINNFGTKKEFNWEDFSAIGDEIANCLESFQTKYPGSIWVHHTIHGGKKLLTFNSKIFLNGTKSYRTKTATIKVAGEEVELQFEIIETFTDTLV